MATISTVKEHNSSLKTSNIFALFIQTDLMCNQQKKYQKKSNEIYELSTVLEWITNSFSIHSYESVVVIVVVFLLVHTIEASLTTTTTTVTEASKPVVENSYL